MPRGAPPPLRPGAARHLAPGVRLPAALRVDAADRTRRRARPVDAARRRGDARASRARVLRRRRAPRVRGSPGLPLPRLRAAPVGAGRARLLRARDRGALALPALPRGVARGHGHGGRVLPRPEDDPPGVGPRARLPPRGPPPPAPQDAPPPRPPPPPAPRPPPP